MQKCVRSLIGLLCFISVSRECSARVEKIKYEVKTLTANNSIHTEDVENEIISSPDNGIAITLKSNVSVLSKDVLQITNRIYHLYANNVGIEDIEVGLFESQFIYSQLHLSHNALTVIRTGTFKNRWILELYLTHNEITTIESGAFDLPRLNGLSLGSNKIKVFHPNSVTLSPRLVYLDITGNQLEKLVDRHFSFMCKTRDVGIEVAENELKEIHPKAFDGVDISGLNLTRNYLTHIPEEIYHNKLSVLAIAYNDLTHLDQEFFDMNTTILRDVHIEGNNFDEETLTKLKPFMEIIEENRKQDRLHRRVVSIHY